MRTKLLNPSPNVGSEYRLEFMNTVYREFTLCDVTYRASIRFVGNSWTVDETETVRTVSNIQ